MVDTNLMTIKDSAARLGINYSTAKHIIKTHKQEMAKSKGLDEEAKFCEPTDLGRESLPSLGKRLNPLPADTLESSVRSPVTCPRPSSVPYSQSVGQLCPDKLVKSNLSAIPP